MVLNVIVKSKICPHLLVGAVSNRTISVNLKRKRVCSRAIHCTSDILVGARSPRPYSLSYSPVGRNEQSDLRHVFCLNQDFQDYRIFRIRDLYTNVPLQKVVLHPGQRNIYLPTPNPVHLVILSILVQTTSNSDWQESLN